MHRDHHQQHNEQDACHSGSSPATSGSSTGAVSTVLGNNSEGDHFVNDAAADGNQASNNSVGAAMPPSTTTAHLSSSSSSYYPGLNLKLLASTSAAVTGTNISATSRSIENTPDIKEGTDGGGGGGDDGLEHRLLVEVRARLGDRWNFAGLFRIGWSNAADPHERLLTFLVVVREDAIFDDVCVATELAARCQEIFVSRGLVDIAVEIAQFVATPCSNNDDSSHPSGTEAAAGWHPKNDFEHDFGPNPAIGRSVGTTRATDSTATLCGYIKVDGRKYGLTCHHGFSSDRTPEDPISMSAEPLVVESPSPADQARWRQWLDEQLIEAKRYNTALQDKKELAEQYSGLPFTKQQEENMAMWQRRIHTLEDKLQTLDDAHDAASSHRRRLGTVLLSSGLRDKTKEVFVPDWALLTLNPGRFTDLEGVDNVFPVFARKDYITPPSIDRSNADCTSHSTSKLKEVLGQRPVKVYKIGRTTGTTAGRLHELRVVAVTYHGGVAVETKAWAVTDAPDKSSGFSGRGDSGAAVVDDDGVAVGMLTAAGGQLGVPSCLTFVLPMEEMLEHVGRRVADLCGHRTAGQGAEAGADARTNVTGKAEWL